MLFHRRGPTARNAVRQVVWRFVGDPAGTALTAAVRPQTGGRSMAGRSGYPYLTDRSSMERAWHGALPTSPQPVLHAQVTSGATAASSVYVNGPSDLSSMPSAEGGQAVLDARYRAFAHKLAARR